MAESNSPGHGRVTSEAALNDVKQEVARRNEEASKAARKVRAAREQQQVEQRRKLDRL
jgi:hypothetical protein